MIRWLCSVLAATAVMMSNAAAIEAAFSTASTQQRHWLCAAAKALVGA
jgi:hypothetical protein